MEKRMNLPNCPICNGASWEYLDHMRDQRYWVDQDYLDADEPVCFKVCKTCGFLTYDNIEQEKLKAIYNCIRPVMRAANINTMNKKNLYHKAFLHDVMDNVNRVLDVGCANGQFLEFLHTDYGLNKQDLVGIEWSRSFVAFGRNEYKLNILPDDSSLDKCDDIKFDMISYYHVFEHCQNPVRELKKAMNWLADDGYLYLSVPLFLDILEESGGFPCDSFENLYHLNHNNCFTKTSFQNLLKVVGLDIVKEDEILYGYTVLCRKGKPDTEIKKENYLDVIEILKKQKEAISLFRLRKFVEAYTLYPKYPEAYIYASLNNDNMKSLDASKEILSNGLAECPDDFRLLFQMGHLLFQWDENKPKNKHVEQAFPFYSNNIKEAEKYLALAIQKKPAFEEAIFFMALLNAKYKRDFDMAVDLLKGILRINPAKFTEMYDLISGFWKAKEEGKC